MLPFTVINVSSIHFIMTSADAHKVARLETELAHTKKELAAVVQLNINQSNTIMSHHSAMAALKKKHEDEMAELVKKFGGQDIDEEARPHKKAHVAKAKEDVEVKAEVAEMEGEDVKMEEKGQVKVLVPTMYCRYKRRCKYKSVCEQACKKHMSSKEIADELGYAQEFKDMRVELVFEEKQVLVAGRAKVLK
jgi:hypothetical protein